MSHLPAWHWQPIETWSTGQGVPDVEYCAPSGVSGWIELKRTDGWVVEVRPHQAAWIERRLRCGGRVHLLVRRKREELWLLPGRAARGLAMRARLSDAECICRWEGGPSAWRWDELARLLTE